jgi:hypothetical protein
MVSLDFNRPSSLTGQQTSAPGQPGFPEKYGHGGAGGAPSAFGFFQALKLPLHAVPAGRYRHQELAHGRAETIFSMAAERKCN